jgi:hypothetical protein
MPPDRLAEQRAESTKNGYDLFRQKAAWDFSLGELAFTSSVAAGCLCCDITSP